MLIHFPYIGHRVRAWLGHHRLKIPFDRVQFELHSSSECYDKDTIGRVAGR